MTKDVTLFDGGLLKLDNKNSKVNFDSKIQEKLDLGWNKQDTDTRTKRAIKSVTQYIPSFKNATVGGPPLFGAQQIPGKNPDLRVGEVSFPYQNYARSEIVKASSALTVANQIISNLGKQNKKTTLTNNKLLESIKTTDLDIKASNLAESRGFPEAMAKLLVNESLV